MKRIIILFAFALVISQGLVCLAQEEAEPTLTPEPPVEVESPTPSPELFDIQLIPIPAESTPELTPEPTLESEPIPAEFTPELTPEPIPTIIEPTPESTSTSAPSSGPIAVDATLVCRCQCMAFFLSPGSATAPNLCAVQLDSYNQCPDENWDFSDTTYIANEAACRGLNGISCNGYNYSNGAGIGVQFAGTHHNCGRVSITRR